MSDTPETDAVDGKPTWQADIVEVGWVQSDFARRLERERDELKKQLIDAKSSTAFWMGKYNNAMQLRGEDPLCDSFWKTLDKLAAERALTDRLAEAMQGVMLEERNLPVASCRGFIDFDQAILALTAWKEARASSPSSHKHKHC